MTLDTQSTFFAMLRELKSSQSVRAKQGLFEMLSSPSYFSAIAQFIIAIGPFNCKTRDDKSKDELVRNLLEVIVFVFSCQIDVVLKRETISEFDKLVDYLCNFILNHD